MIEDCFRYQINMEYQKIINLLDASSDNVIRFITKNTSFISWITKINNTLFDYAEDLGIAMTIYNLIESSKDYSKTSETLQNY